jgi:signal transduction histidine kinase
VEIAEARDAHFLMHLAGMAGWRWDPVDELTLSPELEAMYGYPPGSIRTRADFQALCHPDDHQRVVDEMTLAVNEGGAGLYVHRGRTAAGRWLHLRVTYKTEPHPPSGKYSLQGMVQDVTELAETRDAALRAEQQVRGLMEDAQVAARRLKLALGAAHAGVFEIDHAAGAFWCSPEFATLIGRQLTYDEARALPWPFIHPDDGAAVRAAAKVWRSGTALNEPLDVRVIRPDGAARWMRLYYELRRDMRGKASRSVGLILDVDERKRAELALVEAERAAQAGADAKSRFLASVSHEIRTPMNGVLGVLHLLKNEGLSADGRNMLEEALACGHMLSELLNDVLDFSKIEANQLELSPEPTDPVATLQGVVNLLRPQAEAKGLRLTADIAADIGWIAVDPIRLRQALFNLIGNAVKFTLSGGVTVRLRALAEPARLRFVVEDSGVGIPQSSHAGLFERFHQADGSTTRRFGGTGLGLAITKRLAEMMDGGVGFSSVEGQGSTFWLEIAAPPAAAPRRAAPDAADGLDGRRILVVEDNATNRLIVRKLLEGLGATIDEAEDGESGVLQTLAMAYDAILMDVQMPGMDGLEATRRIRSLESQRLTANGGRRAPIVALTANVLSHQKQAYADAGMDVVVAKPISPALLVGEILRLTAQTGGRNGKPQIAA